MFTLSSKDELRVVAFFHDLVDLFPGSPIAFSVNDLSKSMARTLTGIKASSVVNAVNELLATRPAAQALGGVWTLMQYELLTYFMVRADAAVSNTPHFEPQATVIERVRLQLQSHLDAANAEPVDNPATFAHEWAVHAHTLTGTFAAQWTGVCIQWHDSQTTRRTNVATHRPLIHSLGKTPRDGRIQIRAEGSKRIACFTLNA